MKSKLFLYLLLLIPVLMSTNLVTHADNPALTADLMIVNANVHTMTGSQPAAEAIAIPRQTDHRPWIER